MTKQMLCKFWDLSCDSVLHIADVIVVGKLGSKLILIGQELVFGFEKT